MKYMPRNSSGEMPMLSMSHQSEILHHLILLYCLNFDLNVTFHIVINVTNKITATLVTVSMLYLLF